MKKSIITVKKSSKTTMINNNNNPDLKLKNKRGKKEKEIDMKLSDYDDKTKQKLLLNKPDIFKQSIEPSLSPISKEFKPIFSTKFFKAKLPDINVMLEPIPLAEETFDESKIITSAKGSLNNANDNIINILSSLDVNKFVRNKGASKSTEYPLKELKKITRSLGMVQNFSRSEAILTILNQLKNYNLIEINKYNEIISKLKK